MQAYIYQNLSENNELDIEISNVHPNNTFDQAFQVSLDLSLTVALTYIILKE